MMDGAPLRVDPSDGVRSDSACIHGLEPALDGIRIFSRESGRSL